MSDVSAAAAVAATRDQSAFSWSAALAGGVAAAALTLLLLAFGAGMGFSSVSPWPSSGVSATTFKTAAGLYLVVVAMLSSTVGGYLAGRLRTRWVGVHTDEVVFRDTAHGFVAWAFATVLGAAALGVAATAIVGGATAGATQGAAQAAPAASDYFVDMLLRPQPGAQAPAGQSAGDGAAVRGEVGAILARSVRQGAELPAADRAYLAQVVSARTGLAQAEADKRVNDVVVAAKSALDDARSAAARLSLWLTAAMLIGAFSASLGAVEGGQLRDGRWRGVIGARNYHPAQIT